MLQKVLLDILIVKVFCGTDLNSKVATGKYFAWNYSRNPNRVSSNFVYSMSFRWSFLLWKAFDRFEEEADRAGDHKQSWKEHLMSSYFCDWSYSMKSNKYVVLHYIFKGTFFGHFLNQHLFTCTSIIFSPLDWAFLCGTQGIQYNFSSKQKLHQDLESWSSFSLVLYGKGWEKDRTTLTNPCNS